MVPSSKWKVNDRGRGEHGGHGGVHDHGVHGDCPYHCQASSYCGGAVVGDDGDDVHGDPGDGVDVGCVGDVREPVTVMDGRTVRRSAVVADDVVDGYGVVGGHVDVESSMTGHDYYHCCWCCCCSERTCVGKSDDEMRQQRWA